MAQQAVLLDQDQFCCSVCLDLLKEPVAIPCGHSYCRSCIEGCWDQDDLKGIYSCPQCRQTFTARPALIKNNMLAEVVEKLKKTGLQAAPPDLCYAGPGDVACDFCTGTRKQKALMSCLVCLVSSCKTHLQPHYSVPGLKKHKLVKASTQLQENICSRHDELLKIYCRTDQNCICYLCMVDDHKGHDTVSAAAERTEKQSQLGMSQQKLQQRIQEREKELKELQHAVESLKHSAQATVEDSDRIFTELIHSIERRRSEVKELIRDQEKAQVSQADGLLEQLEQEIAELRRRNAELEQLSHTEDHIHFLQSYQSLSSPSVSSDLPSIVIHPQYFGDVNKAVSDVREKLEDVLKGEWTKISTTVNSVDVLLPPEPKTKERFLQCRAGNRWHTDSRVGDRYAGTDWQRQGVSDLPSPTNVTFSWTNEFCWELSWSLPENVDSQRCKYHINMSQIGQKNIIKTKKETRLKDCFPLMGVVRFSIQTQCNNRTRMSQTVVHTIPAPTELVKNFKCFLYSKAMNCSWLLTNQVPEDLQLYYGFKNMSKVSECSEYLYNDNQRTGCHLIGDFRIRIFFQVNGTLNGSSVRNTFEVDPKGHVQPLPLELKITEEGSNLNISWISPDIRDPRCWEYIINYTRCNTPESKSLKGETWIMVNYDPHCQYRVRIKPIFLKWCGMGEGDWTREEIYGKDGNRDWHLHVAAIFISVMAVIVSIVVCFCIRKHKDKILPQVPKPTNLISDMFNNNNDMSINEHLYIPAQEEVDCKITLVQDPLPQQPES